MAVLWKGRLQQTGTPEKLYEEPANPFVARFVGRANLLSGIRTARGVRPDGLGVDWAGIADPPVPPGEKALLIIRPEALEFAEAPGESSVDGELVDRLYLGGRSRFTVSVASGLEIEVESVENPGPPGSTVRVAPEPGAPPGRIWRDETSGEPR